MIDTNIFDKLITDSYFPDFWQALDAEDIQILTTEIQEKEINRISDERKRLLITSIKRDVVPLSPLNPQVNSEEITGDIRIALTAAISADLFVSEDKELRLWYEKHFPHQLVYDYQQFRVWFLQLFGQK